MVCLKGAPPEKRSAEHVYVGHRYLIHPIG